MQHRYDHEHGGCGAEASSSSLSDSTAYTVNVTEALEAWGLLGDGGDGSALLKWQASVWGDNPHSVVMGSESALLHWQSCQLRPIHASIIRPAVYSTRGALLLCSIFFSLWMCSLFYYAPPSLAALQAAVREALVPYGIVEFRERRGDVSMTMDAGVMASFFAPVLAATALCVRGMAAQHAAVGLT